MACFQKAYSRSLIFFKTNMREIAKKHSETSQTLFTGQTLARTPLCPVRNRCSGHSHRLMPTAVYHTYGQEKVCVSLSGIEGAKHPSYVYIYIIYVSIVYTFRRKNPLFLRFIGILTPPFVTLMPPFVTLNATFCYFDHFRHIFLSAF